jgi:hypothetical protein
MVPNVAAKRDVVSLEDHFQLMPIERTPLHREVEKQLGSVPLRPLAMSLEFIIRLEAIRRVVHRRHIRRDGVVDLNVR